MSEATSTTEEIIERGFSREFGMSSEQFRRELELELEQASPEEREAFEKMVDQANDVLPEMHASLDRIGGHLENMRVTTTAIGESLATLGARVGRIENQLGLSSGRSAQ